MRGSRAPAGVELYAATLSAIHRDTLMKTRDQPLRARGKLGEVALVARMGKPLGIIIARRRDELRAEALIVALAA